MNNPKSSSIAGVLGIILGSLGVHNWYLGEQKKAKRHIIVLIAGVAVLVISMLLRALLPSAAQITLRTTMGNIAAVLQVVGWLIIAADVVWGIVEGILLLMQNGETAPKPTADTAPNATPDPTNPATSPQTPNATAAQSATIASTANPPAAQSTTSGATPAQAASTTNATANVSQTPPPLTFSSQNIQNPTPLARPEQVVGSKDVQAPALTVTNSEGKQTMNPVVKRWLLSGAVLVASAIILGFLIKGGIDSILASAYGESYRAAKEIKPVVERAHDSKSCEYAVQYAKVAHVDRKTYDGYIDTCKSLTENNIIAQIDQLGNTPMVRWSGEIKKNYDQFREDYVAAFPGTTNFAQALQLYQVWHNYALAVDLLTVESPDHDFQAAADVLRTSGNSTLAQYGELWLEKELEYIHAYRTYQETSYTSPEKETLRQTYETLRTNLQAWVEDHRPDVTKLEALTAPNTDALYESFTAMYELIRTGYEQHYDRNSNDCKDSGRNIYCN